MRRTDYWIDEFQIRNSMPVALKIASFSRVPLIGGQDLKRIYKPKMNILIVVMGPFDVVHDQRFSLWQPFKVLNHPAGEENGFEVASCLCRLKSANGHGGFYQIRVWDMYKQRFNYLGNSQHELIEPEKVVKEINEHLAAQYHVGFPEDDKSGLQNAEIIESNKTVIGRDKDRMLHFEEEEQRKRR